MSRSLYRTGALRVLVVTNMYPSRRDPWYGTFVRDQVEALRAGGVEVDVLQIDGHRGGWRYLAAFPRFWMRLVSGRYDVVHAHHPFAGLVARAQWSRPVVLTQHGMVEVRHSSWRRAISRVLARLVDERIYVSPEVRAALDDEHAGSVIPCGVDLRRFVPMDRDAARAELALDRGRRYVLFAADPARPEKRFALAEHAVALARRELPDLTLLVAAHRPHAEMPRFMAASDVLLLTSWTEGSPMVVKEALACGLPVVSTQVGDVPGLLSALDACSVVADDPKAVAAAVVEHTRHPSRCDPGARDRVLDVCDSARMVADVYRRAVGGGRRQRSRRAPRGAVCIVKHGYFPDSHVRRNAEALVAAGFETHVVCLRRPSQPAEEISGGVVVHRQPIRRLRSNAFRYVLEYAAFAVLATIAVARLHLRRRLKVVEVDNMPDLLAVAAFLPRLSGARVVHYVMDAMPELWMSQRGHDTRHAMVRALAAAERTATTLADHVIVTQEHARQHVLARGLGADKVTVVLNTADEAVFRSGPRPAGGVPRVVTHGSVLERYGIHVLCDALPAIVEAIPSIEVDVYGDGEFLGALAVRAERNGVADRFHLHGYVSQTELLDGLAQATVGYVGMLNDLSLPNKLMEFAALEIPVVAARWPLIEGIFPDTAVSYFRPGDPADLACAICDALVHPDASAARAAEAKRFFDGLYGWRVQSGVYLAVYEQLLGGSRQPVGEPAAAFGDGESGVDIPVAAARDADLSEWAV